MTQQTILYNAHRESGALLVDFAGWKMPLHYGSQITEHQQVRNQVGMFDVSHMVILDIEGSNVVELLRYLLANDIAKLTSDNEALYSCMLNERGGVVDDLIVYRLAADYYRMVLNAGTREKDLNWINKISQDYSVKLQVRNELAIIAVQGPQALSSLSPLFPEYVIMALNALPAFTALQYRDYFIARTGYTGEDGVEIILPNAQATEFWRSLFTQGVLPCGLGARDTLRLEAGLNLYGVDMDENTTPYESNLGWTVSLQDADRNFIGKQVLLDQKREGIKRELIGLIMQGGGVLRNHQQVFYSKGNDAEITSGSFSPTLGHSIALARVPTLRSTPAWIERRDKKVAVQEVKLPFVRHGKKVYVIKESINESMSK